MIIGVTGSFGSGKTKVARMFEGLGAHVIDADKVCHSLMAPPSKVYRSVVKHFGTSILDKAKRIDRKKLARAVFKKRSELALLDRLVHPEAIKEIEKIARANKKRKVVVIDAPLLVESGFYKKLDTLVVVKNNISKQASRVSRAKGLRKNEIIERIRMQAPFTKKAALADFIIDNSGSAKKTLLQVKEIWKHTGVRYGSKRKTGY
ncbi:MAG: dephospho-CoA kinase [Candidatus Omnitrophica bacterium]|nr:dephospho-CoA kinase [Candidatus Omnitrophota bacterium]